VSIVEFHVELKAVAAQLGRIADALERAFPPPQKPRSAAPESELSVIDTEQQVAWEIEKQQTQQGIAPSEP
jgi:hypothetical protein